MTVEKKPLMVDGGQRVGTITTQYGCQQNRAQHAGSMLTTPNTMTRSRTGTVKEQT